MPATKAAIPGAAVAKIATTTARSMHHGGAPGDSQRCASSVRSMIAYRMAAAAAALAAVAIEYRTSAFMLSVATTRHLSRAKHQNSVRSAPSNALPSNYKSNGMVLASTPARRERLHSGPPLPSL